MSEPMAAEEIRRRLVEIDDEVRSLPATDFPAIHRLRSEADGLRRQLSELAGDGDDATLRAWSDRAGRKGSHETDDELEQAKAAIVSPMESGGGSG